MYFRLVTEPNILWNPDVRYCVYNNQSLVPIQRHISLIHPPSACFFKVYCNILPSSPRSTSLCLSFRFPHQQLLYMISGFQRDVDEVYVFLGYYAASSGNSLPTFQDNLSVPSSRPKNPSWMEPICCTEKSVRNYLYSLRNSAEEHSSHLCISLPFHTFHMLQKCHSAWRHGNDYKSWNCSFRDCSQPPVTPSLLSPNIFLSILLSNTFACDIPLTLRLPD